MIKKIFFLRKLFCTTLAVVVLFSLCACKQRGGITADPMLTPSLPNSPAQPVSGGELVLPMPKNAVTNDPMYVNTEEMLSFYSLIFESLLSVDSDGKLAPNLAQSWTVDPDNGAIFTIKLRQNVQWHNGGAFTANDVVYTYNRLLKESGLNNSGTCAKQWTSSVIQLVGVPTDPQTIEETNEPTIAPTETPIQATSNPTVTVVKTPRVTNTPTSPIMTTAPTPSPTPSPSYAPVKADASYYAYQAKKIASIKAMDEHTVCVTMREASLSSLYALTFPIMCEADDQALALVGTGGYCVKKIGKTKITLNVNTHWWKQLPYIPTIIFEERTNNETALASYGAGQLNFVPTSIVAAGKYRKDGVTNVLDVMTQGVELIMFNDSNPILKDIKVRKAIVSAIDISRLISNVYMNRLQPCDVPIPPDSWLYDSKSKVYDYNIELAKKLLSDAGFGDGDGDGILEKRGAATQKLSFVLLVNDTTDNTARRNSADFIATCLAECGIEAKVEACSYSLSAPQSASDYIKRLKSGEFDMAMVGLNLSRDGDLRNLFTPNSPLNYGNAQSIDTLRYASEIANATDETAMRAAAVNFQTAFVTELPFAVLGFRLNSIVCSAKLNVVEHVREPEMLKNIDRWYFTAES